MYQCGESAVRESIHTRPLIAVATGWSEQSAVVAGVRRILARLLFPLVPLHPNNGGAFFNDHRVRCFGTEVTGLTLSLI